MPNNNSSTYENIKREKFEQEGQVVAK